MSIYNWITRFSLFGYVSTSFNLLLFVCQLFGYGYYTIKYDRQTVKKAASIIKKSTYSCMYSYQFGNLNPSGLFLGLNCIGWYGESQESGLSEIYIFTSKKYFEKLIENDEVDSSQLFTSETNKCIDDIKDENKTRIWGRNGAYSRIWYSSIKMSLDNLEPRGDQIDIVDDICRNYYKKKRHVSFIYGPPGTGKSTVGFLVAKRLSGDFCHSFNPTDPGDTFYSLMSEIKSEIDSNKPIVIVLEEANTLIRRANDEKIPLNPKVHTCVHNKTTFNIFMDDMMFYKNVILILTSNEHKNVIDALDPCYLRKGRIDDSYNMLEIVI